MKKSIAIIGAGSMGTAISILLSKNGNSVRMWTPFKEEADMINTAREHIHRLPGVIVPEGVICTDDLEKALDGAELAVLAVPSQTIRQNSRNISKYIKKNMIVVSCSKGIEEGTRMLLTDIIRQEIPQALPVALSGPSHAEEIARDIPTTVVAASENREAAELVQNIFMSPKFRVYTNSDVKGVELGGALKNVIALCAGISDGLGFGDNTKAALMTRGITEITRLGTAMGARPQTFGGLTGIGDLIVTCTSMHSRNRRAGILIGQGKSVKEALDEVKMVVEGVATAKPAYELGQEYNVDMPITREANEVLFNGKNPKQAVVDLMMREKKDEIEELI
ncbi:glycerol-3-phosphate dehydrogenase [Clostridium thermosuccinogenes]|jgi:glycerol-3-phosphate dehydrogenase (NAD(P)+)|uniref:Glycerol-3-phosphate dehydrogenase [NAD(P)+] n=1 Tax=Clostridium thermosuccinogenes TaxID=84032 RepID=A0A2K2FKQ5_9CLOT|nr:NAD(P)H-dependent glycerol-3-phosphate dehydrogenase [Pseudoclostridium thermosuccinogenes]AUS95970.1 glycerol-3-phosphate dehydrogenase [Pseudoclostridium thermosuccinogenes]PNT99359.1 glycerol-3-phosphate dehydrogenase [Pseudoclostridium thermosuccinogenes]PNU01046.1 glycerol-3-phosphate dehydrogenase [Pseudoclostridium thermosuccinogenes]